MQIDVATRHGSLSDETRERVATKVQKLQRFFDRLSAIEVIVDLNNNDAPRVDIKVSAEHKHDFVAHGEDNNLWAALDQASQKLEQQLRRYKEKVQERSRNHDLRRLEINDGVGAETADFDVGAETADFDAVDAEFDRD